MELLDPGMAILDETDSGLDIDALKIVSEGGNRFRAQKHKAVLLITHYTQILRYIQPDFVHVFVNGRIADEGGPELAEELEANGYDKDVKDRVGWHCSPACVKAPTVCPFCPACDPPSTSSARTSRSFRGWFRVDSLWSTWTRPTPARSPR